MNPHDEGQGRRDPDSREADRARLERMWPLWVVILAMVVLSVWSQT